MGLEPSTNIPTNVKKETFTFPQYATIALKWVSFHFMVPGHLHSRSVAHRKTNLNSTDVTHVGLGYPMLKDWHSVSLYMRSECYIIFLILKLITVISGKKGCHLVHVPSSLNAFILPIIITIFSFAYIHQHNHSINVSVFSTSIINIRVFNTIINNLMTSCIFNSRFICNFIIYFIFCHYCGWAWVSHGELSEILDPSLPLWPWMWLPARAELKNNWQFVKYPRQ